MHAAKWVLMFALLTCFGASGPVSAADDASDPDAQALREAGVRTDAASLIEFLDKQSRDETELPRLDYYVQQLGSKDFQERENASRKLVALGTPALPALRRARRDNDPETVRRAVACIRDITRDADTTVRMAALRMLLRVNPPGVGAALVRYLPYAQGDALQEEIVFALDALTMRERKADPALTAALKDHAPLRRAAAACILGRLGDPDVRALVRNLLRDTDPTVRLRAAQGLLTAKEKDRDTVPVLIALLTESLADVAWQAEELLHWAAGPSAPQEVVGDCSARAREKCRAAWQKWWNTQGTTLDLAALEQSPRRPGLLWICEGWAPPSKARGRVWLCGCNGKPRWQLSIPRRHIDDIRWLGEGRLLVAASADMSGDPRAHPGMPPGPASLAEIDLNGKELWQKDVTDLPVVFLRLPDGNTSVVTAKGRLTLLDPGGAEIGVQELDNKWFPGPGRWAQIEGLQALDNGRVGCLARATGSHDRYYLEFDPVDGRLLRKARLEQKADNAYQARFAGTAPGGHFFVEFLPPNTGKTWEYSPSGKAVRSTTNSGQFLVLRSSNVLLPRRLVPEDCAAYEIDGEGKRVWEAFGPDSDPASHVRLHACFGLLRLGFEAPRPAGFNLDSLPHRLAQLKHPDPHVRRFAALRVLELHPVAPDHVAPLVQALRDTDDLVRGRARETLAAMGPGTMPALLEIVKDATNPRGRADAISVLTSYRSEAKRTIPVLIEAAKDQDAFVRQTAVSCLSAVGKGHPSVVPALIEALSDRDPGVTWRAAMSLGWLGAEAKASSPHLLRALSATDLQLRICAARALGDIGAADEVVINALSRTLQSSEFPSLRAAAAGALGKIGTPARRAIPDLLRMLSAADAADTDTAAQFRSAAAFALGRMGAEAKAAVPKLAEILRDTNLSLGVRADAAKALGDIGPAARDAIPALTEVLKDENKYLAKLAGEALKRISAP